ncbi:MAG: hypothetical protein JNK58_12245 [Phycisphaerae bacterium]|nr:hypothetical protein [Phycisphaerae bacterium]
MKTRITAVLSACVAAFACGSALGGARVFEDAAAGMVDTTAGRDAVTRARLVTIDRGAFFGGAAERGASVLDVVEMDLFADTVIEVTRRERDLGLGATPMWYGEIAGEPEGYALLVMNGDAFWGKVFSPRLGMFEIAYVAPGLASIRQIDTAALPSCGVDHRHEDVNVPGHDAAAGEAEGAGAERGSESGGFIFADVGLMYTSSARAALGSTAAMEAFLDGAIADANVAYGNSQINLRIRSAFKAETSYAQNATDMGVDLSALQNPNDGLMDEAHTLRNQYGADLVTLIVNASNSACGIGYLMSSVGPSFQSLAFNVVARTCVSGLTFPHELGHNMGCAHDRDNAGGASYAFAYGYRTPGNSYRTVMAYAPGTRVPYFSNPDVTFQGFAMGVPIAQPNPCHNAQAINLNASTIAAWRTLFTVPPGAFGLQTPEDAATTANRTPTFTWDEASDTDYYRLEVDNDPAFGSPEILEQPLTTTSFGQTNAPPMALQPGVTYYWRVTAVNPLGSQSSNPVVRSFTTPSAAPSGFALVSPANGAVQVSRNPSFQWGHSVDSDGYTLTVDNDPAFGSPEIGASGILGGSFTWFGTPLNPLSTYHWKVTSINAIGATASMPASGMFETIGVVPSGFALGVPADGVNINTLTPTLTWTSAGFADSYRVIVDDDLGLGSPVVDQPGLLTTSYQVPAGRLVNGVRYYWQVQAVNVTGSTVSSPAVASFGVIVPNCQGDANGDSQVNFVDISTVLANWGLSGPQGDANHDGSVNFVDISTILASWGGGC